MSCKDAICMLWDQIYYSSLLGLLVGKYRKGKSKRAFCYIQYAKLYTACYTVQALHGMEQSETFYKRND